MWFYYKSYYAFSPGCLCWTNDKICRLEFLTSFIPGKEKVLTYKDKIYAGNICWLLEKNFFLKSTSFLLTLEYISMQEYRWAECKQSANVSRIIYLSICQQQMEWMWAQLSKSNATRWYRTTYAYYNKMYSRRRKKAECVMRNAKRSHYY